MSYAVSLFLLVVAGIGWGIWGSMEKNRFWRSMFFSALTGAAIGIFRAVLS